MLQTLMSFLDNADTERRIAGTVAAVLVPIANQHLDKPLDNTAVVAVMVALMGYVFQSAAKAIAASKAPPVTTPEQAAAVLGAVGK